MFNVLVKAHLVARSDNSQLPLIRSLINGLLRNCCRLINNARPFVKLINRIEPVNSIHRWWMNQVGSIGPLLSYCLLINEAITD